MCVHSGLTTREPSRAGIEAHAKLHHLDELRCPSGSDSGEVVRHYVQKPNIGHVKSEASTLMTVPFVSKVNVHDLVAIARFGDNPNRLAYTNTVFASAVST